MHFPGKYTCALLVGVCAQFIHYYQIYKCIGSHWIVDNFVLSNQKISIFDNVHTHWLDTELFNRHEHAHTHRIHNEKPIKKHKTHVLWFQRNIVIRLKQKKFLSAYYQYFCDRTRFEE